MGVGWSWCGGCPSPPYHLWQLSVLFMLLHAWSLQEEVSCSSPPRSQAVHLPLSPTNHLWQLFALLLLLYVWCLQEEVSCSYIPKSQAVLLPIYL